MSTRGGFYFYYNKLIKSIVFHLSWWHSLKLSFFSNITLIKCATNIKVREVDFQEFFLLNRKSFDLCHNNFLWWNSFYKITQYEAHSIVWNCCPLYCAHPRDPFNLFFFCVKIFTQKIKQQKKSINLENFFCVIFDIFAQLFWIKKIEEGTSIAIKRQFKFLMD